MSLVDHRPRICPGTCVCWAGYACDRRHPSVGKPRPVGLAFGPGSTREGHKERALPDRREPPGIDSSARPRLRRIGHHCSRSVLSCDGEQGSTSVHGRTDYCPADFVRAAWAVSPRSLRAVIASTRRIVRRFRRTPAGPLLTDPPPDGSFPIPTCSAVSLLSAALDSPSGTSS